jgi:hypothetical protein
MTIKKTITSIFMVPTLKIAKDSLLTNGFINGYSGDIDKESQYPDCVYLLFKPNNIEKFREFLDGEYERTTDIIEDYDYPNGHIVVVYKLNSLFKKDYNIIRNGKYSKVSDEFKKLFPEKVTITKNGWNKEEASIQHRIFSKSDDLTEYWESKLGIQFNENQELWEGYDENKELLYIKDLIETV